MIDRSRLDRAVRGSATVRLAVNMYWRERNIESQPQQRLDHQWRRVERAVRDYEREAS